jgi:soluble lytic murein transglycosylase
MLKGQTKRELFVFLLAVACLIILISTSGSDEGGREAFVRGRSDLNSGRYRDAVQNLLIAQREFSILEDYVLIYLSDAYSRLGDYESSAKAVKTLLDKFPSSSIKKRARTAEIREAAALGQNTLQLYEAFVKEFPDDADAYFAYAQLLRKEGDRSRAASVFKKIYIKAGPHAQAARSELAPDDISPSDIADRAANLIKQYDYEDAERELRQALSGNAGPHKSELLKQLAYAYFKQKKYRDAAERYGQVNDLFFRARSLYRAGDRKGFDAALSAMTERNDKRAGFLLLTVAADRRREKDFEGAVRLYQDILKNYPSDSEDALWGVGWTQYLSGDFNAASETFSRLYGKYADPKYLYWQARSMEAAGDNASALYAKIISGDGNSFYAALSYARSNKAIPRLSSLNANDAVTAQRSERSRTSERIDALLSVDMRSEAASELAALCRNSSSTPELAYSAAKFYELGDFRRSVTMAAKIPYSEKVHRLWYPLAFWDKVSRASQRNDLDPYLVLSIMREESRFDHAVKSPAGAYGLMQLMPQTAYRLDRSLKLGIHKPSQLTDPESNIQLGTYYLKSLLEEFRSMPHMIAAYNAGELAVRNWQQRFAYRSADEFIEDIPYNETRNYVKKVITSYFQYRKGSLPGQDREVTMESIIGRIS